MSDDDPRLSALYRRAPRSEPHADSDETILRAARMAARRPRRSYVPWAVAATLVLGVGIGWRVMQLPPPMDEPAFPQQLPQSISVDRTDAGVASPEAEATDAAGTESPDAPAPAPAASAQFDARMQRAPAAPRPGTQGESRKRADGTGQFGKALSDKLFEASPGRLKQERGTPLAPPKSSPQNRAVDSSITREADEAAPVHTPPIDCAAQWLPDEATRAQWQAALVRAGLADDLATLRCLEARYLQLFGEPPPAAAP